MFCSVCGTSLDQNLNFCSRCGNAVPKRDAVSVSENLAQSVAYVGGFGLLGSIFFAIVMIRRDVPIEAVVPLVVAYLATLFGICWLMLSYSYKMSARSAKPPQYDDVQFSQRLNARTTAQLDEHREPAISVVEDTTRTLDKVPFVR